MHNYIFFKYLFVNLILSTSKILHPFSMHLFLISFKNKSKYKTMLINTENVQLNQKMYIVYYILKVTTFNFGLSSF